MKLKRSDIFLKFLPNVFFAQKIVLKIMTHLTRPHDEEEDQMKYEM